MQIKPAARTGIKPFIGFFGLSNGGKTHSALLFARGLAGPQGKIGVIDTEEGRASIFADIIPGGFDVIDLKAPFRPSRYIEAMAAFSGNCDVLVIDSASHEWRGESGVLDLHEQTLDRILGERRGDYKAREKMSFTAWREPKMEHEKLRDAILRYPVPVIVCLRAKEKIEMVKNAEGKTELAHSQFPEPIFDSDFIFEMVIAAEVYSKDDKSGFLRVTKRTRDEILACLPGQNEQVAIRHGEALRNWCAAPTGPGSSSRNQESDTKAVRAKLWEALKDVRGPEKNWKIAQQWLADELAMDRRVADLTAEELERLIIRVDSRLSEAP